MRKIILALLVLVCWNREVGSKPRANNRKAQQEQAQPASSPSPLDSRRSEIDDATKAERERYEKERDAKEDTFIAAQLNQNGIIVKATFWMAIFAGVNLIVAVVYAVFAWLTLRAVKKQANHASEQVGKMTATLESMEKEQGILQRQLTAMETQTEYACRAYVCIPVGSVKLVHELPSSKDRVVVFSLRVENFGNTPANDVRICSFTEIVTDVPDPTLKIAGKKPHRIGLIAPHAHTEHWIRTPELSREDDQRWVNGDIEVCCGGVITYNTFGKTRTTKFCLLQRVRSMSVEPYGKWSEAD